MGAVAHSSFTARGIAERQAAARARDLEQRIAELEQAETRWKEALAKANDILAEAGLKARPLRMFPIAMRLCKATGFSLDDIKSERKGKQLVLVRQAIAYWIARRTGCSTPEIGRFLGGRDHTTALHAIRTYPKKRAKAGKYLRPLDTGKRGN